MFVLRADKNKLQLMEREQITSGSVNVYRVRFEFSPDWDGMTRRAVFIGSGEQKPVMLDEAGECDIPWETMTQPGGHLFAGAFGKTESSALPTVRADLGVILEGVPADGEPSRPPTPDLWEQELAKKGDALGYTDNGELGLYSGDRLLSAVPVVGGGGGAPAWGIGHGLKVVGGDLTVDTTDDFNGDNTLPMTAAGVQATVGNIEALLGTI